MTDQPSLTQKNKAINISGKKLWWTIGVLLAVLLIGTWWWFTRPTPPPAAAARPVTGASTTTTPTPTPTSTPTATTTVVAKNMTSGGKAAPAITPSPTPTSTPTAVSKTAASVTGSDLLCVEVSPLWEEVEVPQVDEKKVSDDANQQRLYLLTQHYRNSGVWVMLKAAGYRWDGNSCLQQFQPEETSFNGTDGEVHTVIVATRLWGTGTASYPTAMSTGEEVTIQAGGRLVKFDENPPAKDDVSGRTCTDCSITSGPHSIWSSGGGNTWQLWPDTVACTVSAETTIPAGQMPSEWSQDCK